MWPFTVRTPLCGATGDEEYVKRLGELLLSELDASYRGLSVAHGGSQVITTYKFRVGTSRVVLELETYIGATLIASRPLTRKILLLARAYGFNVLSDDESTTAPHG
jgi:hypothetical protein